MNYSRGYNRSIPKTALKNINNLEIDYDLFRTILGFRSHSGSKTQDLYFEWLKVYIQDNISNVTVTSDEWNIYVVKGDDEKLSPCIVSHIDINQDEKDDVEIFFTDKLIFGFDYDSGTQCGIGADDKVGNLFALMMLKKLKNVRCVFTTDEEVGCIGAKHVKKEFFKNASFLLQLDRNSYQNDISDFTNGVSVVTDEFKLSSKNILSKYKYNFRTCVYTDIGEICKMVDICAVNISCGYFNEHGNDEIISTNHMINSFNFAYELLIVNGYKKKWHHVATAPSYNNNYGYGRTSFAKSTVKYTEKDFNDWLTANYKRFEYSGSSTIEWYYDKDIDTVVPSSIGDPRVQTKATLRTKYEKTLTEKITFLSDFYKWREENYRYYGLIDNEAHYFHVSKIGAGAKIPCVDTFTSQELYSMWENKKALTVVKDEKSTEKFQKFEDWCEYNGYQFDSDSNCFWDEDNQELVPFNEVWQYYEDELEDFNAYNGLSDYADEIEEVEEESSKDFKHVCAYNEIEGNDDFYNNWLKEEKSCPCCMATNTIVKLPYKTSSKGYKPKGCTECNSGFFVPLDKSVFDLECDIEEIKESSVKTIALYDYDSNELPY